MKIVYVLSPYYDYLTATLVEGLQELGHQVLASENSNYAHKVADQRLIKEAENADLIIVGSNQKVASWLLDEVENPNMVFVDGSDHQDLKIDPFLSYKMVFKRELSKAIPFDPKHPIFPLPFAAERRYFYKESVEKDIRISFAATFKTNPLRYSVAQRLKNLNDPSVFVGTTGERAYHTSYPVGTPIETPVYRNLLFRSRIGINVAGAGYDCGRYWEIPAAGALLFTQKLDIQIPNPFVDGETCIEFNGFEDFEEKLAYIEQNPSLLHDVAHAGYLHCQKNHSTLSRASYFLDVIDRNKGVVSGFESSEEARYTFRKRLKKKIRRLF